MDERAARARSVLVESADARPVDAVEVKTVDRAQGLVAAVHLLQSVGRRYKSE